LAAIYEKGLLKGHPRRNNSGHLKGAGGSIEVKTMEKLSSRLDFWPPNKISGCLMGVRLHLYRLQVDKQPNVTGHAVMLTSCMHCKMFTLFINFNEPEVLWVLSEDQKTRVFFIL